MTIPRSLLLASLVPFVLSCGGKPPPPAENGTATPPAPDPNSVRDCSNGSVVQTHDLSDDKTTHAFTPCASAGKSDYSGLIQVETIPEGVHIIIHATDDQVNLGALGDDVRTRDAVLVYPRGKDSKAVEVPLLKTANGYTGDKIVLWNDLDTLTDEGTKIQVAIYDHDGKTGETSEELSLHIAVSTGKSCQRAIDENPQTLDMGKKGGARDLTNDELGAPMRSSGFFSKCNLPDASNAELCVAVKKGKPVGVSVSVTPKDNKVAACIDKATRKLSFPSSERLDVVHQKF
jgi:hypothetical protein